MTQLHPAFDWPAAARIMLTSRRIDDLEEQQLLSTGEVTYQFSAGGHELGQALISQLLGHSMDAVGAYYRSRPLMLGLGLSIEEALASDMARSGSMSAGRDVGVVFNMPRRSKATVLPLAGDVGSQYTPAAGWAQSILYRIEQLKEKQHTGSIVVVFGGDGSVASNGFWSSLTMATTLKLPMLFVIEDNGFAISVNRDLQTPGGNIAENLASFHNLEIWDGSGTIPSETAQLIYTAMEYMRSGKGPGLLRLVVPRLSGHSSADNQAYKSEGTRLQEIKDDPIPRVREALVPMIMDASEWEDLTADVESRVMEAYRKALAQAQPVAGEVSRFVFSEPDQPQSVGGLVAEGIKLPRTVQQSVPSGRRLNMVDAIRQTLDHELTINPRCLIFGEDVGEKGGVHTATMGLMTRHGRGRVVDTSLSEEGIIGRAVGMALAGLMPVPEIQFRKYADPATEQLNNCGTIRWRTANKFAAPMVVRIAGGYGRKVGDPWHSVTSEVIFAHAVGWQVVVPSNAEDAVGLLRTAMRGNDPVIFFEHRALLDAAWSRRPYPGDDYAIPFGKANVLIEGTDLTIVTWGAMTERCQEVVKEVGASIELIDLRTISPWDKSTVLSSVSKTAKCLIVHEDMAFAGFGGEISATIAQEAFMALDGPIIRLAAPQVPIPFNTNLMAAVVPEKRLITERIEELLAY